MVGDPQFSDVFGRLNAKGRKARLDREVTESLRRRIQRSLYQDIADTSIEYDSPEPGGFLAQLVAGYDPRSGRSGIGQILDLVRMRGPGAMPTEGEWEALADMLDRSPAVRGEYVDLECSRRAAEKLLPYLYEPCRQLGANETPAAEAEIITPLTADEIETFAEIWNEEY